MLCVSVVLALKHNPPYADPFLLTVDLSTRSGLKKVHAHFNDIYKKLDCAYVGAQRRGNEKLMGGIVGVWAKMCADAILRDKLFHEGTSSRETHGPALTGVQDFSPR